MKDISDFTGIYSLSQTMKFELKPIGSTAKKLEDSGLLNQDLKRAEDYPKVKDFLDGKHKIFLQKTLSKINDIDWQPLADAIDLFQKDRSQQKMLEAKQSEFRKAIVNRIKEDDEYALLTEKTPSKLFKYEISHAPDVLAEVKTFGRFACYFKGYQENRANIYSAETQQTSAAYRAVNDNFTKFATAVKIFKNRIAIREDLFHDIMEYPDLEGQDIKTFFEVQKYNLFLSQKGIDNFNRIVANINYVINQYRQQHPEISTKELPFLPPLFKQILSDRERKFATGEFQNASEVCKALLEFIKQNQETDIHGEKVDLFSSLRSVFASLKNTDDLFIDASELTKISSHTLGRWDALQDWMETYADHKYKTKNERSKYCGQKVFNFRDLNAWLDLHEQMDGTPVIDWLDFWKGENVSKYFETERALRDTVVSIAGKQDKIPLQERKDDVNTIKEYLDAIQDLLHSLKPLVVGAEYGGDLDLQGILQEHFSKLAEVIPLYNRIRNFITRKISESGKIKLMFDNPTLADGWDSNKEQANTAVIFLKDNAYFLGIMNPKCKTDFSELISSGSEPCYKKMVYKQIQDPTKDLPNLMRIDGKVVRKTGRKNAQGVNRILEDLRDRYLPVEINRIRKNSSYLASQDNFSKDDLIKYIDFYKEMICEYKSEMKFTFRPSCDYATWIDFTNDIKLQAYKITFSDIPVKVIDQLVEEGKLFLFQIWNKDFAEGASGTPNKFTLYWKSLFDPRNLSNTIFKLNGEAELFYREPPIKKPVCHKKGEKLVNRTIVTAIHDGKAVRTPIDENVYYEIFRYVNHRLDEPLSEDAAELLKKRLDWADGMHFEDTLGKLVVKDAKFDMVKDRRFTQRKFLFHVPITINFKADDKVSKFNDNVREFLHDAPDVNIIGIDRGERNLIYLVLMDQQGHILEQRSFNIIGGVDYQEKLNCREKERDQARKSWSEIGKIKDLKAGYLSGVVHEIARMMIRHKAIVVMEDLNTGFKRGRSKIEKQVYQKFERALIEKLNYLVFKDTADPIAAGGVMNGYQLTEKFDSFKKMGKQCGFIFYVPAWCTSKIDPVTGFIDFFGSKYLRYESAAKTRTFFSNFNSIRYIAQEDFFEFDCSISKFTDKYEATKPSWKICSFGDRLESFKDASGHWNTRKVILSAALKEVFERAGISLDRNILTQLQNVPESKTDFWRDLLRLFKLTVQMRNSQSNSTSSEDDYIISPIRGKNGMFFDSRKASPDQPCDADANGAYNIARKGLWFMKRIKQDLDTKMTQEDWLRFVQR